MNNYLSKYRQYMDGRVANDPKKAPSDTMDWTSNGMAQLSFLQQMGLKPDDYLLDYGAGTLSFGSAAISYLHPQHYIGMDISASALDAGKKMIGAKILEDKKPQLIVCDDIDFTMVKGIVTYVMAFSVINHLPSSMFVQFLQNIPSIMAHNCLIFATVRLSKQDGTMGINPSLGVATTYNYSIETLNRICKENKFTYEVVDTNHPGLPIAKLTMLKLRRMI